MKNQTSKRRLLSLFTILALGINVSANEADTQSLGTMNVTADSGEPDKQSYTVPSMSTSTKLNLSIKETPQSVTVMTVQELQDKGISSYQGLLAHITGISLERWDERLKTTARGFDVDYFKIDGVPTYETWNGRDVDLSMFERVEIVRGANGLTTGAGNPGISINLVRKKANSKELEGNVTVKGGSWNAYGATADVGSKLNANGTVRGRVVLKHEGEDSYMDGYERKNNLIYGVLGIDITDTTNLSLGASYHKLEKEGIRWGGLPAFDSTGSRIDFDRSDIISEDWTYLDTEETMFFADLEQLLYKDIALNVSYSHNKLIRKDAFLYFYGQPNRSNGSGVTYYTWKADKENIQDNIDVNVDIPFTLGGLEHQVVVGASYNKDSVEEYLGRSGNGTVTNFYDYSIAEPANATDDYEEPSKIVQKALYLSSKFSLTPALKLIAGARVSAWKSTSEDAAIQTRNFTNEVTPYVGLVYDLDENHSVYASYTSIFNPQKEEDKEGNFLDPIEGKSYEAGIKGEYFDGALNASLSVFRIEQDGVAEKDGKQISNPTEDAYRAAEGVTSKGFELDINGRVNDRLNLGFGIANFEAKDANGDKFNTTSSRTTGNAFVKYYVTKALALGAGLQYKSKFYKKETVGKITQKGYAIANVMASYEINKHTDLQLNVSNLFDKKYYEGIGYDGMVYGEPRKMMLTLKYTF